MTIALPNLARATLILLMPIVLCTCATMGGLESEPLDAGKTRSFDASPDDVTRVAVEATVQSGLEVRDILEIDGSTWMILAEAGASASSWGELVRVVVHGPSPNESSVRVVTKM